MSDTNRTRIYKYLKRKKLAEFTAGDIAKPLNLSTNQAGGYLKDIPGVTVLARRRYARLENGTRYTFTDPECAS